MDQEKIGKFIAKIRKEKNMTQIELAEKLGVTDRAVSNWENGRRLPDYSILRDLCDNLDITVNELLNGEKIEKNHVIEKYDNNLLNILKEYKGVRKIKNRLFTLLVLVICVFIFFVLSVLISNKTFFKTTYIGMQNQEIFIPRYSFFKEECCMTTAVFYSLKSEKQLKKEINHYIKDFEHFINNEIYGYQKDGLFIQNYEVVNHGLYRMIYITY